MVIRAKVKGESSKENTNGVTLKVFRKHIKRLVNYAEVGDGVRIREELKRIVPEYRPEDGRQRTENKSVCGPQLIAQMKQR